MDTRFWGPPGWKLLHSVSSGYPESPPSQLRDTYRIWFQTLPEVLPCIYCRRSLSQYYRDLPATGCQAFDGCKNLSTWLYHIHNKVNDKLRQQGLNDKDDPSLKKILKRYCGKEGDKCLQGWDFLYAIALNYPEHQSLVTKQQEQNYYLFFSYLPKVMPHSEMSRKMARYAQEYPIRHFLKNRIDLSKWLYGLEKSVSGDCCCYSQRCREVEQFRAGCKGKGDEKPTCRATSK